MYTLCEDNLVPGCAIPSLIFHKLLGGYVDRVTDWCVTGHGFAPRRVQL